MNGELTPREREVCDLVTHGMTNKEIGHRLGISFRTVEVHRERILDKYGVHNAAGLTRIVVTAELTKETT